MMRFLFISAVLLLSRSALCEIDQSQLKNLISALNDYKDSKCGNKEYTQSAQELINKLNTQVNAAKDPKLFAQFSDAKKGFIEFELDQSLGTASSCGGKISDSISKLKILLAPATTEMDKRKDGKRPEAPAR